MGAKGPQSMLIMRKPLMNETSVSIDAKMVANIPNYFN